MNRRLMLPVALTTALFAFGQMKDGFPARGTATPIKERPDCVNDNLAYLRVEMETSVHKAGQPLGLTLVLSAGEKGVYLPDYFGDFLTTCQHGFSASILTEGGGPADPTVGGCMGSILHSTNDTALTELHNFTHLNPGETRVWHTTIATQKLLPGKYQLIAEYISAGYKIDEVAKLPQVGGLMAIVRIRAKAVPLDLAR